MLKLSTCINNTTESLAYMIKGTDQPQSVQCLSCRLHTVKPVLSDRIKQDIFLAFQKGGCILLSETLAEA